MKNFFDIFSIISVFIVTIFATCLYFSFKEDSKYESQKLGVSVEQLKSNWGKPDSYIKNEYYTKLIYNSTIYSGNKYVFTIDNKTKILKSKFYDD